MDPNTAQPQEDTSNLKKLEEDLQKTTQEAVAQVPNSPPPAQVVEPMPGSPPVQPPEAPAKKGSPILMVALVLMGVAVLAVVAYVVGIQFFGKSTSPTAVPAAEVSPTELPFVTPAATSSATPMATASASASPKVSPSSSPSASPNF